MPRSLWGSGLKCIWAFRKRSLSNEEGSKVNENIHLPAASKCCPSTAERSSVNVILVSHQRPLWSLIGWTILRVVVFLHNRDTTAFVWVWVRLSWIEKWSYVEIAELVSGIGLWSSSLKKSRTAWWLQLSVVHGDGNVFCFVKWKKGKINGNECV